jgi:hypothetical protein
MSYNRNNVLESINENFGNIIDLEWGEFDELELRKLSSEQLIELIFELNNYI